MRHSLRTIAPLFASMALLLAPTLAPAQSVRTGDGFLMLNAEMPSEARAGQQFEYTVEVSNVSDNVVLHDIELKQTKAEGFSVDSVTIQKDQQNQKNKEAKETKSQQRGDMKISKLEPGQSRTLTVKATADKEGELRSCLEIVSYTPALCLTSQVVKPELNITKNAPKKANRCDVIELQYTVKNDGSGDLGAIQVTDELGDGLTTIEGNNKLTFDVDGLAAGESRQFVARVYAQKTGEFSSRATAKAKNSDLQSRSAKTNTKIVSADLAAKVEGPNRIYGDDLARFTATITNTGNATAKDVTVHVMWPQSARLADIGQFEKQMSKQDDQKKSNQKQGNDKQPTVAKADNNSKSKGNQSNKGSQNDKQKRDNQEQEMAQDSFKIDSLAAGESATFEYAIRPGDLETIPTKVEARWVCAVDASDDLAKAEAEATAIAMAEIKIVRLPAMQMVVIDDEDPVADGSQVVYRIRVWNEGDAPDHKVQIKAEIPEELEFVSAEGPTKHNAKNSTLTFEPIETMEPGDRVDYRVVAKSTGSGNVRFKVKLNSEALSQEVIGEEPTRLFARQASK